MWPYLTGLWVWRLEHTVCEPSERGVRLGLLRTVPAANSYLVETRGCPNLYWFSAREGPKGNHESTVSEIHQRSLAVCVALRCKVSVWRHFCQHIGLCYRPIPVLCTSEANGTLFLPTRAWYDLSNGCDRAMRVKCFPGKACGSFLACP